MACGEADDLAEELLVHLPTIIADRTKNCRAFGIVEVVDETLRVMLIVNRNVWGELVRLLMTSFSAGNGIGPELYRLFAAEK